MNSREFGIKGEKIAMSFFEKQGFTVLSKNFRFGRSGEIDLVVRKENLVVFVEVKNRRSDAFGGSIYAIGPSKIEKLKLVADAYLRFHPELKNNPKITFRFDLLAIKDGNCEWIQDIIR